jgi:phosphate/sulfate permease
MKKIIKIFVYFTLGFNSTGLSIATKIGANDFQIVIVFIILSLITVLGWKGLLDWVYED